MACSFLPFFVAPLVRARRGIVVFVVTLHAPDDREESLQFVRRREDRHLQSLESQIPSRAIVQPGHLRNRGLMNARSLTKMSDDKPPTTPKTA